MGFMFALRSGAIKSSKCIRSTGVLDDARLVS